MLKIQLNTDVVSDNGFRIPAFGKHQQISTMHFLAEKIMELCITKEVYMNHPPRIHVMRVCEPLPDS